jgi:hypothetical protein
MAPLHKGANPQYNMHMHEGPTPDPQEDLNNEMPATPLDQDQLLNAAESAALNPESLATIDRMIATADQALSSRGAVATTDQETGVRWMKVGAPGARIGVARATYPDARVEYTGQGFGVHNGQPGLITYIWRAGDPTVTIRTMHEAADGGIEYRDTPAEPQSIPVESQLSDLVTAVGRAYPTANR